MARGVAGKIASIPVNAAIANNTTVDRGRMNIHGRRSYVRITKFLKSRRVQERRIRNPYVVGLIDNANRRNSHYIKPSLVCKLSKKKQERPKTKAPGTFKNNTQHNSNCNSLYSPGQ